MNPYPGASPQGYPVQNQAQTIPPMAPVNPLTQINVGQMQQNYHTAQDRTKTTFEKMKEWATKLKFEVLAVYFVTKDPRCPTIAKVLPIVALAYLASPIDLIPDCIPILGQLDDLIIVPGLLWLSLKFIPPQLMEEARQRALSEPVRLDQNWLMACGIFACWILIACLLIHKLLIILKFAVSVADALVILLAIGSAIAFGTYIYKQRQQNAATGQGGFTLPFSLPGGGFNVGGAQQAPASPASPAQPLLAEQHSAGSEAIPQGQTRGAPTF